MIFLRHKAVIVSSAIAAVMGAALLGNSLTYAFSEDYKSWKQYGSEWSDLSLGSSSDTVAESGCAVTAAAILMVHSGSVTDKDFDPGVIVSYLNQHGGFSSSGLLNWNALSGYNSDFCYVTDHDTMLHGTTEAEKAQEIKNLLDEGYYVMVRISSGDSTHFVAIDSVHGSRVTMMDPGSKSTSLFEKYKVGTVTQVRLFKGKNSPADMSEEEEEQPLTEGFANTPETSPVRVEIIFQTETTVPELPAPTEVQTIIQETAPAVIVTEETVILTTAETTEETTTTTTTTTATVTETEAVSTAPETQTEVVIFTKPAEISDAMPETAPDPLIEEQPAEEISDVVEFFLLEDAPEIAPEISGMTSENAPIITGACPDEIHEATIISVPFEQAQAKLFEIGQQHVLMSIRFTIKTDTALYQEGNDGSEILVNIPAGTSLNVVETDSSFQFGKVSYNGSEGWISLNFAEL